MSTHYKLLLGSALSVLILGGCSAELASRVSALEVQAGDAAGEMSAVRSIATGAKDTAEANTQAIRALNDEHDSDMEKMRMMERKMGRMKMKMRDHKMKDGMMK